MVEAAYKKPNVRKSYHIGINNYYKDLAKLASSKSEVDRLETFFEKKL